MTPPESRTPCAVIGSGNIGTDLLYKLLRSPVLRPVWMAGIDPASDGLARARALGIKTTDRGVDGLLEHVAPEGLRIAFDATSAAAHAETARKLAPLGVLLVDLTPSALGPGCVPPVNLKELAGRRAHDVNLISCGGQATIPMVAAVVRGQREGGGGVRYAEIVATVASRSAGPGTRRNIDEFTRTTARGLVDIGGAARGKAIIVLNPAEPPLVMRNTVHCLVDGEPRREAIERSVAAMAEDVRRYVPGYRVVNGPVFDGERVSVFLEVEGLGDYLPRYAGNLDIMTAAAVRAGELFAGELTAAGAP